MEALLGTLFVIALPIYWGILLIIRHLDKRDALRKYREEHDADR